MSERGSSSRENWIEAARRALIKRGIEGVKVDRLAQTLKITRGSFYHHFESRKELLEALQRDWESRNLFEIAEVRDRWRQHEPDLSEVVAVWVGTDSEFPAFDIAVRMWARQAKAVAQAVEKVDEEWIKLLSDLFSAAGLDDDESLVRARVTYYHQIGYYALDVHEPRAQRLRLLPTYYRVLTGREPSPHFEKLFSSLTADAPGTKR
jgi:AcrR family transcriptional regulator